MASRPPHVENFEYGPFFSRPFRSRLQRCVAPVFFSISILTLVDASGGPQGRARPGRHLRWLSMSEDGSSDKGPYVVNGRTLSEDELTEYREMFNLVSTHVSRSPACPDAIPLAPES